MRFLRPLLLCAVTVSGGAAQQFGPNAGKQHFEPVDSDYHTLIDVDSDGDLDVFTAILVSSVQSEFYVHVNDGKGTFSRTPAATFGLLIAARPYLVLAADLDLDGRDDFVEITSQNVLRVQPQVAPGRFGAFYNVRASQPALPTFGLVTVADLDGDRDPDLVVNMRRTGLLMFFNDGQGRFTERAGPGHSELESPLSAGDVDGDGDVDLIRPSPRPTLYLNDGQGRFTAASGAFPLVSEGLQLLLDIDGDGDLDSCVSSPYAVSLLVNDGTGRFTNETTTRLPPGLTGIASAIELGGDGHPDLLLPGGRVLRNDGAGFFSLVQGEPRPDSRNDQVFDADGDGDDDILAREVRNRLALFLGNGVGEFVDATMFSELAGYSFFYPALKGDFDGDGDLDLVSNEGFQRNRGNATFDLEWPGPRRAVDSTFDVGDVDADGDLDLMGSSYLENDGTGQFGIAAPGRLTPSLPAIPRVTKLVDADNDGDLDAYFGLNSGGDLLYLNDGLGNFRLVTGRFPSSSTRSTTSADFSDVDGDGGEDALLIAGDTSSVLINNGFGYFAPRTFSPPIRSGSRVQWIDLDGDGDEDLVAISGQHADLHVDVRMNQQGRLAQAATYSPGGRSFYGELADIDLDGDPDLILAGWKGTNDGLPVRLFLNDGLGAFTEATGTRMRGLRAITRSLVLGDFDSDGDPDLVVGGRYYGNNHHQAFAPRVAVMGEPYAVDFTVSPTYGPSASVVIPILSLSRLQSPIATPFGRLHLDLNTALIFQPSVVDRLGVHTETVILPTAPALNGRELHWQALAVPESDPASWRFTNLVVDRILR